jgi:galactitol-specific phosphotransferase system IIC component
MMCPPSILRVRIHNRRRHFGLWLPLFLVWPVVMVFGLVLWPLLLIGAAILWPIGWGRPLLLGGPAIFALLCALRGLKIEVNQPSEQVIISFQ